MLAVVDRVLNDPDARARSSRTGSQHHFGDTTPGAATARFHEAVDQLIAEWERHAPIHAGDRRVSESDPLDDDDDEEGMPSGD